MEGEKRAAGHRLPRAKARAQHLMRAQLTIIPVADGDFRKHVLTSYRVGMDTKDVQAALRTRYPRAVVVAGKQDPSGEDHWYAYREGLWPK